MLVIIQPDQFLKYEIKILVSFLYFDEKVFKLKVIYKII